MRFDDRPKHRRRFLQASGALGVAAMVGHFLPKTMGADTPPTDSPGKGDLPFMRIGVLMGTFSRPTLEERFEAIKSCGLDCVQLNLGCAGVPSMPEAIPDALADRIRLSATARGIAMVSVEGTFNMSHPDAESRRQGLARLRVLAAACQRLGTPIIHLCTGTRDRDNMWRRHPDNDSPEAWRDMVGSMREAAVIAKQCNVVLAFEPEVNNVVDSAKKARRLMDEVGSPRLKVTMDAANLFHAGELARMREVLDESFALIGKDIVLAHAKDLSHDGDAGHEPAGHGRLDYDRYVTLLHDYGFHGPLLLHGLSEFQVPGCVRFLKEKLASLKGR